MLHCDKCKVDIADNINNCPLCGRDLDNKAETQSFVCYPDNKIWINKRNLLVKILFWVSIIGTGISIFLELLLFHKLWYNWYVITGEVLFLIDFVAPLKFKWSYSAITLIVSITISLYILFLELFTHSFGWGLNYAIPLFLLFSTLYTTSTIITRNYYKGYDFVVCLMVLAILCTALFIYNILTTAVFWPALVAFLTSVTCFVGFLIFRFKKVKAQIEKKFFI